MVEKGRVWDRMFREEDEDAFELETKDGEEEDALGVGVDDIDVPSEEDGSVVDAEYSRERV